jgi:tRNA A37 methylthiotransferase MiaB
LEVLGELQAEIADAKRAELVGTSVDVLVEQRNSLDVGGRTWREAPEVDGHVVVTGARGARVGDIVSARVVATDGLDLIASVA